MMLSLTLKSIRANTSRFVFTVAAICVGVAFMAGTFVLTDTIKRSYDDITADVYRGTDAVVRSARTTTSSDQGESTTRGTVSAATLEAVRAVPGVATAEPQLVGIAVVVGRDGRLLDTNPNRSVPVATAWTDTAALNPLELVAGHAPRTPEEIVIDRDSARKGHFAVGDVVHVVGPTGSTEHRIAGIATYGGAGSAAGSQVVAFPAATAEQVLGTPGRYAAIRVVGIPGTSQSELAAALRDALHEPGIEVVTGAQATREAQDATMASLGFVSIFLLTAAVVALVVGAFVIFNTFSITVAQRTRETALLRAIGARRRQVLRAVRLEALVTGIVASAAGVVAGIGMASGLRLLLTAFGMDLPSGGAVVLPRTVAISMITGVVVTLLAAWVPARRAARVAPIAAMRDVAVDHTASSKRRIAIGTVVTVLGAVSIGRGLSGSGVGPVSLGAFGVFFGVALLGPVIASRFARIVGAPLPRLRGVAGELARENAMRNPRRTAATASALMVGIALVAFMTIFAASAKASMSTSVDRAMRTDFIVTTQFGMGGLSPDVARQIDALPETGEVMPLRYFEVGVGGSTVSASAVDPARVARSIEVDLRSGDMSRLGTEGVAVRADIAKRKGVHVGDPVTLTFPETGDRTFTVVAVYGIREPVGDYIISTQAFDANVATHVDNDIVVSSAPGVSIAATRAAVERVLRDYPTAELLTKAEFKGSMAAQIDQILNLVYVLLAMALLIALFGIANTLALSVVERRREIGLLRAIGMSRAQVRSTVRWESVLIALLGTSLGSVIGFGFAWALSRALVDQGFNTFAVPVVQLTVIVGLAAVAAVVAASRPAHRAASVDILGAIASS